MRMMSEYDPASSLHGAAGEADLVRGWIRHEFIAPVKGKDKDID
jgi:hypothetical protein